MPRLRRPSFMRARFSTTTPNPGASTTDMVSPATKVTSPGSQFSASDVPTAPNPTPFNESAFVYPNPPFDHAALANHLADNQDRLNEAANEAMYPSPPINTPEALSPAPSIVGRIQSRGRGISIGLGDRLAQVKLEDRRFHRHNDCTSSNRSVDRSLAEECEDCDCASEVMSDGDKDGIDPGRGSSPTMNPRLEEYLSFTSTVDPIPEAPSVHADHVSTSSTTLIDGDNTISGTGPDALGVTERTNWAEEVEEYVDGALQRLEQLAKDEHVTDSIKNVEEYYIARLQRMLNSGKRLVPVTPILGSMAVKDEDKDEETVNKGNLEKEVVSDEVKPGVLFH